MKFFCDKSKLQDSISIVQKAVTGKSTMPILEGILLIAKKDEVILIGSDLDLSIQTKLPANVIEPGTIVLDSKLFGEIIRKMPNDIVTITKTDDITIQIECQKSMAKLVYMKSEDYPKLPHVDEETNIFVPQGILKNMIRGTIFAVAQDETRPILTGILFEVKDNKINLVALDGFRLALKKENIQSSKNLSVVIPGKTLNELSRILKEDDSEIKISFTNNHILFDLNGTKVISILLTGEFFNYNSIIPDEYNLRVIAKRNELLNCIERASLMAKEGNTNLVKLNIENEKIIITSDSQLGKAREEMNIILQGENLKIAFNSKYLIDVLKIMDGEEIVMELSSGISPCVIKNKDNQNCTYLVLPVRLLNN